MTVQPDWLQPLVFLKRLGLYLCTQQPKILSSLQTSACTGPCKIKYDSFHGQGLCVSQARCAGGAKAPFHCSYTNKVSIGTSETVVSLDSLPKWDRTCTWFVHHRLPWNIFTHLLCASRTCCLRSWAGDLEFFLKCYIEVTCTPLSYNYIALLFRIW